MPKFCPNCGAELSETAAFCANCGSKAEADASKYVQLDKPIPAGLQIAPDGGYQWTAERSVWMCMPFFKIVHIVCAVFVVLIFILIICIEAGKEDFSAILLHCLIGVAIMAVIDFFICLFYAAKRAFRFKAVFTVGSEEVSAVECEAEGRNVFVLILQLIAGLASHGDVQYGFRVKYEDIAAVIPESDKMKIRVKTGGRGGFLLTSSEQFDFILFELQQRINARKNKNA